MAETLRTEAGELDVDRSEVLDVMLIFNTVLTVVFVLVLKAEGVMRA